MLILVYIAKSISVTYSVIYNIRLVYTVPLASEYSTVAKRERLKSNILPIVACCPQGVLLVSIPPPLYISGHVVHKLDF